MEIYKLKDDIVGDTHQSDLNEEMAITDLKQGVKNPNRVNVFISGKFAFSLDIAQVVDMGVKVGRTLTIEELEELKRASEFGKSYQRALEWALVRPRSVQELRDYLWRKARKSSSEALRVARPSLTPSEESFEFSRRKSTRSSEDVFRFSNEIIERLKSHGYVDDRKFAEFWVENRFVKKGISQKRLRMELVKKGVAMDIIEEVLGGRNDEEEIRKIIAKKRKKYTDEKLIAYLCRQGFSYDLARELVEKAED